MLQKILKGVKVNNNIQFAKIGVRKQSRAHQTALVFLGVVLLAVLSFFTVLYVRAYFTSTDTKSGELTFGTIEVKLLNGESEFTASSFQTKYLTGIMPGSTLNFNSINVKNTGTHSAYVLLNLDISIPSKDGNANKLLHYNKWFNADGEEVNTTNMAINQTKPTRIASGGSVTSNIQWKVPSIVGNDYKTSTVTVNMTVYGTQTNLKDAVAYADHELYASYFICKNATDTTPNKNLFNADLLLLRSDVTKNSIGSYSVAAYPAQYSTSSYKDLIDHLKSIIQPNVTYTLSRKATNANLNAAGSINILDTSGKTLIYVLHGEGVKSTNFTLTQEQIDSISKIYIYGNTTTPTLFEYFQLEVGSSATNYSPHRIIYSGSEITTDPLRKIVTGKNLFDKSTASSYGYGGEIFVVDEVQCAKIYQTDGTYSISIQNIFKENTQYTLKFREKYVDTQGYVRVEFQYADGTSYKESYYSGSTWGTRTITSDANKTISKIRFSNAGNGVGYAYYVDLDSLQIEKGTTATTYEAYSGVEDTFDINTQTLTRNVAKYEFKGTEAIGVGYDEIKAESSAVLQFSMPNCAEVANYGTLGPIYCNRLENIKSAYISNSMLEGISVLPDANPYGGWLRWRIDVATYGGTTRANATSEFKNWLATLYSQGNPFTVWFQMETPTTENVLTSKNLYQGNQRLKYKTGANDNNINQPATITITQNAEYSFDNNPGGKELGGDLFDMMFNNPTVLSYKLKRNTDDVITNSRVSVNFMNGSNSLGNINAFFNAYDNDEEYHLIYIAIPKLSELTYSSTVDKVHINFADYSKITSRDFIIKDIQIEVGVAPTDFEGYDPTEYKRVNGVALRQVGNIQDTYNPSTKKVTRNVGKYEFTGNETFVKSGNTTATAFCVYTSNITPAPLINSNYARCNIGVGCGIYDSSFFSVDNGFKINSNANHFLKIANTLIPNWEDSATDAKKLELFKSYIKTLHENGNSVTVWYQVATPTTETLS